MGWLKLGRDRKNQGFSSEGLFDILSETEAKTGHFSKAKRQLHLTRDVFDIDKISRKLPSKL